MSEERDGQDLWFGGEEPDYPETEEAVEEPTEEQILAIMASPELMEEYGYRLTPKGHMGLVLMQLGVPKDLADTISEEMGKRIFDAGWTYIPQEGLDLEVPDGV
jgi:hypothetical protein